jgi:hypothetical protein
MRHLLANHATWPQWAYPAEAYPGPEWPQLGPQRKFSTGQMAILVDGIVTYVGSPEECQRRLDILQRKTPDPSAATVGLVGLSVSPNNFERLC